MSPSPTTPAASWNRLSQPVNLHIFSLPANLLTFLSFFFIMLKERIIFNCYISPRNLGPFIKMRKKNVYPLVPFLYILHDLALLCRR